MSGVTHRDLCRAAARWLLELKWCHVAGYEVGGGGGVLDAVGVSSPQDPDAGLAVRAEHERVTEEWRVAHERWVETQKGRRPLLNKRWGVKPDRPGKPRIVAVEVKRTRADLLADLRVGKLLRYEGDASECYLAVYHQAMPSREELAELGLPGHWGILRITDHVDYRGVMSVSAVRTAKRHRHATVGEVRMWTYRIGRSLAYRATQNSPVAEESA
jgi:hypothetical protein